MDDFDQTVDVITGYFQFCIEVAIPVKHFKTYSNNHPWMNNAVKDLLKAKHQLHRDNEDLGPINAKIKTEIQAAKHKYKDKVMSRASTNPKEMWRGLKLMMGCGEGEAYNTIADVDDLNEFFCRFERPAQPVDLPEVDSTREPPFTPDDVTAVLRSCKPSSSCGPDNIPGWFLKHYHSELSQIIYLLFTCCFS
ncbi:hypothetical protein HOLleu_30335 [Holothuria leucospilota]|uniref:Uncharacterized protein n=1 Tax=Holothuria leucospilota TaxID=206669 RepID=A0A9Q1GYN4_HOLLE|nr:hypothetical protein HOLleu_30335 [Holothuria leucospilota]